MTDFSDSTTGSLSFQEKLSLARGLTPDEPPTLDALVALASDPQEEIRDAARDTLQRIPDEQCAKYLLSPSLSRSVALHFLEPGYFRPVLLPILLIHRDAPQDVIDRLAATAGPEVVAALLDQIDCLKTSTLLALKENPTYLLWQKEPPAEGFVIEVDLLNLLIQEMQKEGPLPAEVAAETPGEDLAEAGIMRKIAKMNVAQRVKLALLGTREERAMLVRDPNKVVWRAVLSSPKLTEADVETFSSLKNVSQDLLQLISVNRKFMKNYTVLRNLVNNPRTTISVSLPLLNRLLPNDLRSVSLSRDVPDTLRKMSLKLMKERGIH
jgi:hypothetical protein